VSFGKNAVGIRDLIESVEEVGFQASVCKDNKASLDVFRKLTEIEYYWRALLAAIVFNVAFLVVMALHQIAAVHMWLEGTKLVGAFSVGVLIEWVLVTPVNFWIGRKIHIGAFKALSHRSFTMDVLLSLGCNAAYVYSVVVVVVSMTDARYHAMIMFETPVMVITFVMLGR
jgi:P-type Cu+ transporter